MEQLQNIELWKEPPNRTEDFLAADILPNRGSRAELLAPMSLPRRLWSSYLQVLERRPMRTQMIQSFVILSTGDVIAQKFVEGRADIEAKRVLRFGTIGCFLIVSS